MGERLRVIIVGLGNQGGKRLRVAGPDVVACVDPNNPAAQYRSVGDVPLEGFDAAIVCTPEAVKTGAISYLLEHGKHVLVEKPLLIDRLEYNHLHALAQAGSVACYTAYNHRFEPAIQELAKCLAQEQIGEVFQARLTYGNGTARNVRDSEWRDTGDGVLTDLGSHLLDLTEMLFGRPETKPVAIALNRFENRAFDHCVFAFPGRPMLQMEISLLSWKNDFSIDVIGSAGSAHVRSLVKWGPSTFTRRIRVLPSGRPDEESRTWECQDPTWASEYQSFKELCRGAGNALEKDAWIASTLAHLVRDSGNFP